MRQLQSIAWIAALAACAAVPAPGQGQAVEACPILKVSIAELPESYKLQMHPSVASSSHTLTSADYMGESRAQSGINVVVLWQNKTSQPLRDLAVRLEYQQSKTSAFRLIEQQVREAKPGSQWTQFLLRGGEFEDTLHIAAWHVTVVSAGQMLGEKKSVMWR